MAKDKQEQLKMVIRGIARFPNLSVPRSWDNRTRKFVEDYEKGSYQCDVVVDEDTKDKVEALYNEAMKVNDGPKKVTSLPFEPETDYESGELTGNWIIKTKMTAQSRGRPNKPKFFDSKVHPITDPAFQLTPGSEIKVSFRTYVHPMGCTFYFDAIQVVELAGGHSFQPDLAFSKEDGFEAEGGEFDDEPPF